MKKYIFKSYQFFILISLLSLLYIRHYEKVLYYKPINKFLDIMYSYVAIPSFYYFIAAGITSFIINSLRINIFEKQKKIFKYSVGFVLIIYIILTLSNILYIAIIPFISFWSIYSIIFFILGCFFAFIIKN